MKYQVMPNLVVAIDEQLGQFCGRRFSSAEWSNLSTTAMEGIRQHGSTYSFFGVEDSLPLHCLKQLLLTLPVASVNQLEGASLLS